MVRAVARLKMVYLVYSVDLVCLVCLVYSVDDGIDEMTRRTK